LLRAERIIVEGRLLGFENISVVLLERDNWISEEEREKRENKILNIPPDWRAKFERKLIS
jgi:hypothetical protein